MHILHWLLQQLMYDTQSQSISQAKTRPWFAAEPSGTIICAHFTCMAGLGEACSHIHVSALLFAAETHTRLVKILPVHHYHVAGFLLLWEMSLTNLLVISISLLQRQKKKKSEDMQVSPAPPTSTIICPPTECELKPFMSGKPSLLSIVRGYCDEYIVISTDLPTPK